MIIYCDYQLISAVSEVIKKHLFHHSINRHHQRDSDTNVMVSTNEVVGNLHTKCVQESGCVNEIEA